MPKISEDDSNKLEKELKKTETIINSMTLQERKKPEIIKNSRKIRIAEGSGTTSTDVNRILDRFDKMKKQMSQVSGMMKRNPNMINEMMKSMNKK